MRKLSLKSKKLNANFKEMIRDTLAKGRTESGILQCEWGYYQNWAKKKLKSKNPLGFVK